MGPELEPSGARRVGEAFRGLAGEPRRAFEGLTGAAAGAARETPRAAEAAGAVIGGFKEAEAKVIPFRQKLDAFTSTLSNYLKGEAERTFPIGPRGLTPTEIAGRGYMETVADVIPKAGKFIPVTPSEAGEMEAFGMGLGALGKGVVAGAAKVAPRGTYKTLSALFSGAPREAVAAVESELENVSRVAQSKFMNRTGFELPESAISQVKDAWARLRARQMVGLGHGWDMGPAPARVASAPGGPDFAGLPAPGESPGAGKAAPKPPVAPIPVSTSDTAAIILAGDAMAPGAQESISRFPRLYQAVVAQSGLPEPLASRVGVFASGLRQALGLPKDAPITPGDFHVAISQAKASYIDANNLDRAIFEQAAQEQGIPPEAVVQAYEDSQEAARRPLETMAYEHAPAPAPASADIQTQLDEAYRAAQEKPEEAPHPILDLKHPETGQAPQEMPRGEFIDRGLQETKGEVSAGELAQAHREVTEAAKESGREVPADVLESVDETTPEQVPADVSFDFGENAPGSEGGRPKTVAEMTVKEFREAYPGASPEVHKDALRRAVLEVKPFSEEALQEYPDVQKELEDIDRKNFEKESKERSRTYSPTPLLDELRKVGLNREAFERGGYMGEAENLKGRGIWRTKGGLTPDQAARSFAANGLISDEDIYILLERVTEELRGTAGAVREGATPEYAAPFYSKMIRAFELKMGNSATAEQVRAILRDLPKDEVEWSGIEDYIKGKEKIGKKELLDFLRANELQIKEIVKSEKASGAGEAEEEDVATYEMPSGPSATRYGDYTLPGGENYREILLTLPGSASRQEFVSPHFSEPNILAHVRLTDRIDRDGKKVLFLEEIQSDWHQKGRKEGYAVRKPVVDELTGAEAEGEGIESGGVPNAPLKRTWPEFVLKRMIRYAAENGYERIAWTTGEQQIERYPGLAEEADLLTYDPKTKTLRAYLRGRERLDTTVSPDGLPDLIGRELSSKLLGSPLTKGATSADFAVAEGKNHWAITKRGEDWYVDVGKGTASTVQSAREYALRMYVGDRGGRSVEGLHELRDEELKIGGHGMRGFYDKIIPDFLRRFGKKWGASVSDIRLQAPPEASLKMVKIVRHESGRYRVELSDGDLWGSFASEQEAKEAYRREFSPDGVNVHSIEITPELRDAALYEGFAFVGERGLTPKGNYPESGGMTMRIGGRSVPVSDLEDASRQYQRFRDFAVTQGAGGSGHPEAEIFQGGKKIARISYNGKVWPPEKWFSGQKPLLEAVPTEGTREFVPGGMKAVAPTQGKASPASGRASPKSITEDQLEFKFEGDEAQQALGQDPKSAIVRGINAIAEAVMGIRAPAPESVIRGELTKHGFIDYDQKPASGPVQVAELAAAFRDPRFEHFQAIFVKNGKRIAHQIVGSGLINAVVITDAVIARIEAAYEALGADGVWVAHNHPSGDPTASDDDIKITKNLIAKRLGKKLKGHIVTNHKKFSLIDNRGNFNMQDFATEKENFRPISNGPLIYESQMKARAVLEFTGHEGYGLILLDNQLKVSGVLHLPADAQIMTEAKSALERYGARHYVIVGNKNLVEKLLGHLTGDLLDVISFDGEKASSMLESRPELMLELSFGTRRRELLRAKQQEPAIIAESGPQYEVKPIAPAIPEQFAEMVQKRKVGAGTKVTVSSGWVDPHAGVLPRGRKGKVIAVDLKGGTLLVDFGGRPVITNPNRLVETSMLPAPEKPLPAKEQIAKSTGLKKGPAIGLTEQQLLKLKLRSESRGAKIGARAAARKTKAEMLERFRERLEALEQMAGEKLSDVKARAEVRAKAIQEVKDSIVDYLQKNLPRASWGKFVTMIRDAKTPRDAAAALWRVDAEASLLYKRSLMDDIGKLIRRTTDAPGVAVEFRRKIEEIISVIDQQTHRESTLEKLRKTRDWIEREKSAGREVDMPEEVLEQLSILTRQPLKNMSEDALEEIRDTMADLEEIGRTFQRSREAIYEMRKQRLLSDLLTTTKPLEKHPQIQRKPGEILGWKGNLANRMASALDFYQSLGFSLMPMDVFFDFLDGNMGYTGANWRIFKRTLDRDFSAYLNLKDQWILPVRELVEKLGLTEQNFERIGVHAVRAQKGGREYLRQSGLSDEEINSYKLTPAELQVYRLMREMLERPYNDVRRLLAELYNEDIGKVENYFPFLTDWETMSDVDVFKKLGDSLGGLGKLSKSTEQGFKHKRVGGKQKLRLNALEIFEHHMDDVAYFLSLQKNIKMLKEIAGEAKYGAAAGDVGQLHVLKWIDLMAKKGGAEGAKRIAALDALRRNLGAATLGFKLSSILIQPSSLLDAAAIVGGAWISQGLRDAAFSREWREFLIRNIPELRHRAGDDVSFSELTPEKVLAEAQRTGFVALEKLDKFAAIATAAGAYRKALAQKGLQVDLENPDADALESANLALRRSQSSPYFKDLGLALTRGDLPGIGNRSVAKMILQFKAFMLNRWSIIKHDMMRLGWKEGSKTDAAWAAMYLGMANAAEMGIRASGKALMLAILGGLGLAAKKAVDDEDDDFAKDTAMQFLSNVPFVGDAAQIGLYRRAPLATIQPFMDLPIGAAEAARAEKSKTALRGIVKALTAMAGMAGVPGASQASQIFRMILADNTVRYPLSKELSRLEKLSKAGTIMDDERPRLAQLKASHARFSRWNQVYKKAMDRGDTETAERMVGLMRDEAEKMK